MSDQVKSAEQIKAELERRKNDIIRVHNPTMEEYFLEYDKYNTNVQWVFPAANTDQYGAGRGNRDVPRYIAERFMEQMAKKCVYRDLKKQWDATKKEYRKTDDVHREEERLMFGAYQDEKLLDVYREKIWIGLVRRNGDIVRKQDDTIAVDPTKTSSEQAIERLGLEERVIEESLESFAKDIQSAN